MAFFGAGGLRCIFSFRCFNVYSQGRRKDVSRLASRHVADVLGCCPCKLAEVGALVSWPIFGQKNHPYGFAKQKREEMLLARVVFETIFFKKDFFGDFLRFLKVSTGLPEVWNGGFGV